MRYPPRPAPRAATAGRPGTPALGPCRQAALRRRDRRWQWRHQRLVSALWLLGATLLVVLAWVTLATLLAQPSVGQDPPQWGTWRTPASPNSGDNQSAAEVPLADAAGYYTATHVEGALAELRPMPYRMFGDTQSLPGVAEETGCDLADSVALALVSDETDGPLLYHCPTLGADWEPLWVPITPDAPALTELAPGGCTPLQSARVAAAGSHVECYTPLTVGMCDPGALRVDADGDGGIDCSTIIDRPDLSQVQIPGRLRLTGSGGPQTLIFGPFSALGTCVGVDGDRLYGDRDCSETMGAGEEYLDEPPGVEAGAITTSGLTMATSRLLGRTTAGSGAVEEITVGAGLALAGGELSATGGGGSLGGSTGSEDNRILRADGTGGATVQGSAASLSDDGKDLLLAPGTVTDLRISAREKDGTAAVAFYDNSWGGLAHLFSGIAWADSFNFGVTDPPGGVCVREGCTFSSTGYYSIAASAHNATRDTILSRASAGVWRVDDALRLDPVASAPIACSAGNSGTMYMDSTSAPDELCVCDGSSYQPVLAAGDCT
jgi:hypothetical protein